MRRSHRQKVLRKRAFRFARKYTQGSSRGLLARVARGFADMRGSAAMQPDTKTWRLSCRLVRTLKDYRRRGDDRLDRLMEEVRCRSRLPQSPAR